MTQMDNRSPEDLAGYLQALQAVFCLFSYSAKRGLLISCGRADLTGISVTEKGPVALNFCAADFLGEVLMLLGWCFLLTPH